MSLHAAPTEVMPAQKPSYLALWMRQVSITLWLMVITLGVLLIADVAIIASVALLYERMR
jgi:hypothetical protein